MKKHNGLWSYLRKRDFILPIIALLAPVIYCVVAGLTHTATLTKILTILSIGITIFIVVVYLRAVERRVWMRLYAEGKNAGADVSLVEKNLNQIGW